VPSVANGAHQIHREADEREPKSSRARGLMRHIGSRGPSGHNKETAEAKLIAVAAKQKTLSAETPNGRVVATLEVPFTV
jgi:hypothetical protein